MPIKAKQVVKIVSSGVGCLGVSVSGTSFNATTAITTALSTAGSSGVSVPLQVSTDEATMGVVTASPNNRVEVNDATSKNKFQDLQGNEVYGRIAQATSVYTLSFYTLVNGAETAYNFANATSIDFFFLYRFDFNRLPADFAFAVGIREIAQDPKSGGGAPFSEQLTVTATNTVSALTKTPTSVTTLKLIVNGETYNSQNGSFTLAGKAVTWVAASAGISLDTTDFVVCTYFTNE